ncbi:MAG: dihydropteridine reductase [Clostridia bacterium]|nr:dihydropteridine reductase [Clostridia bacterium]
MKNEINAIEKIRVGYVEKEVTKYDQLKDLDKKVKRPAKVFAYVFGSISALVLGTGMSLAMKVIGTTLTFAMPLGIGVGLVGILLTSINYPMYKKILKSRKNKYSEQILELSDSILNN